AYIDRKKKLPVTTLLRALGYSTDEEIVAVFDLADPYKLTKGEKFLDVVGRKLAASVTVEQVKEVIDEDTGEVVDEKKERKVLLPAERELKAEDFETLQAAGI